MLSTKERCEQPAIDDEQEQLTGGRVRGKIVIAHLRWVETYGDRDDVAAIATLLPHNLIPDAWFPFADLIAIDRAISERFGHGIDETALYEDLGRFCARADIGTRFEVRTDGQHHAFFAEAARRCGEFQDFETIAYRRLGGRRIHMRHTPCSCFSRIRCATVIGYYEQCLITHGALNPMVTEETCRCLGWDACKFELRWS